MLMQLLPPSWQGSNLLDERWPTTEVVPTAAPKTAKTRTTPTTPSLAGDRGIARFIELLPWGMLKSRTELLCYVIFQPSASDDFRPPEYGPWLQLGAQSLGLGGPATSVRSHGSLPTVPLAARHRARD